MIKFKINGSDRDYPTCWDDVTFEQYVSIMENAEFTKVVALFLGMDEERFLNVNIDGLELLLEATQFVYKSDPQFEDYYQSVGGFTLPDNNKGKFDIRFESLGQFLDMEAERKKHEYKFLQEEGKPLKFEFKEPVPATKAYARYLAIYLQKIEDGTYSPNRVVAMQERVMKFKAYEVLSIGQFFFLKLIALSSGTHDLFRTMNLKSKNLKPDLTTLPKSSAPTAKSRKSRKR